MAASLCSHPARACQTTWGDACAVVSGGSAAAESQPDAAGAAAKPTSEPPAPPRRVFSLTWAQGQSASNARGTRRSIWMTDYLCLKMPYGGRIFLS